MTAVSSIPSIENANAIAIAIERMLCRLKDVRRIATRYDKLARNDLASRHSTHAGCVEARP
jgi:transposase